MVSFVVPWSKILLPIRPYQIEANDISAQICDSGTVTFSDTTPQFTKEEVDNAVREVQEQTALLSYLEQQLGRSKEFLSKVCLFLCQNLSGLSTLVDLYGIFIYLGCEGRGFRMGSID